MLHHGHKPDLIISSNACRALHSAVIFHRVFGLAPALLQTDPHLYLAGIDEILNVIYGNDDENRSLMIFGHNPGFTDIANYLSNMDISNVPTTGVVILEFDTDRWIDIDRKLVTNEIFEFPRKN